MKKIQQVEFVFIILLIATNMAIGILTFTDYGESWDETRLYEYGDQSINAYRALLNPHIPVDFGTDDLRYYGPAYFMGMSLLVKGVKSILTQTPVIDLWHLGNFACLQLGLVSFYFLLRRFIKALPALSAVVLFASQPLIWGHAFINPKDIPFMAFFITSVYCGLRMLDHFATQDFELRSLLKNRWFYASAVSLGLTISLRILGFAAAGIVLFYFAFTNYKKVLRLSYAYFGSALVVSFLTWPYLWASPLVNFAKGIYVMFKFQWEGKTLFNGVYYSSNHVPRIYVPQLLSMQWTETALLVFVIGIAVSLSAQIRNRYKDLVILFFAWFMLPLLYILINGMNLYDNARQLLFIIPGMFLMIAIGVDFILERMKPVWAKTLILLLIVIPGIAGIIRFHPYEYAYYNLLTTSRQTIFRNYETDYWATSYKEISTYINDNAPKNSLVIVWGPSQIIRNRARKDIEVKSYDDLQDGKYAGRTYYLVLTTRYNTDQVFFPEVQPIYSVQNNQSILAVVKYITPQQ